MTRIVKVGNLSIGGNNPIIIQSMTNTNSADVEATVKQINELEKAGCQLVRMTINNVKAAEAIKEIKKRVNLPLVADIHFDYRLALLAIENGIDKLRINPGNIGSDENVKKVVEAAKEKNIPVVFYNRKPSDEAIASYDKLYYVGIDPNAQGIAQGELIEKLWKENPDLDLNKDGVIQYVMLTGEPGHPDAVARTKYSISTLNDHGIKTEELHQDTAMWDTATAKDKMDAWLSGPNGSKIEVVICNNDGMALGAIESMKATGKILPTFGVDALPEALVKIEAGEMAGTVLNDAKGQASATFNMVVNLAAGKEPTEGTELKLDNKIILIPSIGIDKSNVADFK